MATVEQFNYSFGTNKSRPIMQQFFVHFFKDFETKGVTNSGLAFPTKHLSFRIF